MLPFYLQRVCKEMEYHVSEMSQCFGLLKKRLLKNILFSPFVFQTLHIFFFFFERFCH